MLHWLMREIASSNIWQEVLLFASRQHGHEAAIAFSLTVWKKKKRRVLNREEDPAGSFGARSLRRVLRRSLEDPVAYAILNYKAHEAKPFRRVVVDSSTSGETVVSVSAD
ncbi:hypothetical protein AK812_SmicGene23242 [Symbiodinium microadriaticum]|uniref:Clp ATPase C-terminal domain-containing protein n=1 Tax=Symbiodinium microadriaticum TaxID=2951 RepID=A0A1Q9DHP4_SYMMI|nr:hypothetical protein AK812_SmicGene23242 [Symbiodinium microadriaticum]